jgi:glycosyltransferase involved in cell wall biosynthesis
MSKFIKSCVLFLLVFSFADASIQPLNQTNTQIKPAFTSLQQFRRPKLCLTMIVKNESRIIERCLNSVKDVVDCISICDTGSTDNTVELIERFMQKNGIVGKVHHHSWKNFGHNRSLSAEAAVETLNQLGFPLAHTYLLLLDADMMLEVDSKFLKDKLIADSYMLQQQSDTMSYYNTRLVKASLPWKCVGVTHEYWSCGQPHSDGKLDTLKIDDHEDGGCKADKFERDVRLLTQGLKDEPDNVRYLFYLAQSYMCLDQLDEAIKWYKDRIDKGGWIEEVWYAKMMVGECYERKDEWDQALHWYLDAYEYNPARAEPLKRIATHYRVNSQPNIGYLFAKQGTRIPYPKDQLLFVSHPVYDYELDEEISIVSYYMQNKDEGFAAADKIALKKNVPSYIKEQTLRNMAFYAETYLKKGLFQPVKIDYSAEMPVQFITLAKTKEVMMC